MGRKRLPNKVPKMTIQVSETFWKYVTNKKHGGESIYRKADAMLKELHQTKGDIIQERDDAEAMYKEQVEVSKSWKKKYEDIVKKMKQATLD